MKRYQFIAKYYKEFYRSENWSPEKRNAGLQLSRGLSGSVPPQFTKIKLISLNDNLMELEVTDKDNTVYSLDLKEDLYEGLVRGAHKGTYMDGELVRLVITWLNVELGSQVREK